MENVIIKFKLISSVEIVTHKKEIDKTVKCIHPKPMKKKKTDAFPKNIMITKLDKTMIIIYSVFSSQSSTSFL